jgi:hypothetical protein
MFLWNLYASCDPNAADGRSRGSELAVDVAADAHKALEATSGSTILTI